MGTLISHSPITDNNTFSEKKFINGVMFYRNIILDFIAMKVHSDFAAEQNLKIRIYSRI